MSNLPETTWIHCWQRRPEARVRLLCFPYAGGGASIFRTWHEYFPQNVELCSVRLPGREGRLSETPYSNLNALIEKLAVALSPFLDIPYAFFGHSMGALVGFELTRYLRRTGGSRLPLHLFASGRSAPQFPLSEPPISQLPEPEFIEELRRLRGTPEAVLQNAELIRLLLPGLRADFGMCENYRYVHDSPLTCPITAFSGLDDLWVTRQMATAWKEQTSSTFRLRLFDGDHFFLLKERSALIADILQSLFFAHF